MGINSSDQKPSRRRVTSALKLDESTAGESLNTTRRDLSDLRKPRSPVEGILPHLEPPPNRRVIPPPPP